MIGVKKDRAFITRKRLKDYRALLVTIARARRAYALRFPSRTLPSLWGNL